MLSTIKNTAIAILVVLLMMFPVTAFADEAVIDDRDDSNTVYPDGAAAMAGKRDEHGQVSWLNTESNNPYHNLMTLRIDLGAEFADFESSEYSEGIIVKCRPGDVIKLPTVKAKPGYTFVGWSQGGVPEEIDWDVFTTEVKMTEDADEGNQTALYAVYMSDDGSGYCTCGAYTPLVYEDKIDELKAKYATYLKEHGNDKLGSIKIETGLAFAIVAVVFLAGVFVIATRRRRWSSRDKNDVSRMPESSPGEDTTSECGDELEDLVDDDEIA